MGENLEISFRNIIYRIWEKLILYKETESYGKLNIIEKVLITESSMIGTTEREALQKCRRDRSTRINRPIDYARSPKTESFTHRH